MLKSLVKRAAKSVGYEIRKIQPPPPEHGWIADVQRLFCDVDAPIVFDVGANVGSVSHHLASAFPPPARLAAFEPSAATFAQLTATMAPFSHVQTWQLAIGDRPGRLQLYHSLKSELNRLAPVCAHGTGTHEEVEVTTIDEIAQRIGVKRIDLLKTDTEGFDTGVLRGASGLLAQGAIRAVLSEATFDLNDNWHTHFDDLRALLVPLGFCLHGIYDCEREGLRVDYCNVLFLHSADFTREPIR